MRHLRLPLQIFFLTFIMFLFMVFLSSCSVPSDVKTHPSDTTSPKINSTPMSTPASAPSATTPVPSTKTDIDQTVGSKTKRQGIPDIPANHLGRTACTACHASGVSDIPKLPPDHSGRADNICAACHKQAGAQSTTSSAQEPKDSSDRAKMSGPLTLPPSHMGRTICTACHKNGVAGASKLPSDHSNRTDDTCNACHNLATSQPAPTTSEKEKQKGPPGMPANHQGRATCKMCHDAGLMGAPKAPSDHSSRADATCSACHKLASSQPTPAATPSPTATPASTEKVKQEGPSGMPANHQGRATCKMCHDAGLMGAPKSPSDHSSRADATCSACHKLATSQPTSAATPSPTATPASTEKVKQEGPPGMPANHQGRATCKMCHDAGLMGAPKAPSDHSSRTDATCSACHKPGS